MCCALAYSPMVNDLEQTSSLFINTYSLYTLFYIYISLWSLQRVFYFRNGVDSMPFLCLTSCLTEPALCSWSNLCLKQTCFLYGAERGATSGKQVGLWGLSRMTIRSSGQVMDRKLPRCARWNLWVIFLNSPWLVLTVLEEATVLQVGLDDDVGDGIKHKLHVLGVGGAGEVAVDFLGVLLLIQILKFGLDVSLGFLMLVRAWRTATVKQ